jgi:hypothetical protein
LKQARQRASRLFWNDGARSSLPQYLQSNFGCLDERAGRPGVFLIRFALAVFGLAAADLFPVELFGSPLSAPAIILPFSLTDASAAGLVSGFN